MIKNSQKKKAEDVRPPDLKFKPKDSIDGIKMGTVPQKFGGTKKLGHEPVGLVYNLDQGCQINQLRTRADESDKKIDRLENEMRELKAQLEKLRSVVETAKQQEGAAGPSGNPAIFSNKKRKFAEAKTTSKNISATEKGKGKVDKGKEPASEEDAEDVLEVVDDDSVEVEAPEKGKARKIAAGLSRKSRVGGQGAPEEQAAARTGATEVAVSSDGHLTVYSKGEQTIQGNLWLDSNRRSGLVTITSGDLRGLTVKTAEWARLIDQGPAWKKVTFTKKRGFEEDMRSYLEGGPEPQDQQAVPNNQPPSESEIVIEASTSEDNDDEKLPPTVKRGGSRAIGSQIDVQGGANQDVLLQNTANQAMSIARRQGNPLRQTQENRRQVTARTEQQNAIPTRRNNRQGSGREEQWLFHSRRKELTKDQQYMQEHPFTEETFKKIMMSQRQHQLTEQGYELMKKVFVKVTVVLSKPSSTKYKHNYVFNNTQATLHPALEDGEVFERLDIKLQKHEKHITSKKKIVQIVNDIIQRMGDSRYSTILRQLNRSIFWRNIEQGRAARSQRNPNEVENGAEQNEQAAEKEGDEEEENYANDEKLGE
jgi:outer membrane murein-binding lipoprotein Lpp